MTELFGIPIGPLSAVLAIAVALAAGALAVLAVRNRVLVRLGFRSAVRRPGRTALIVTGLMLGTTIISAALTTGDTMNHSIRSSAVQMLGNTDELVSAKGAEDELPSERSTTGVEYFPERFTDRIRAVARPPEVDGVAPAIVEPIAALNPRTRQTEPRVTLFASESRSYAAMETIRDTDGHVRTLAGLARGEVYLNDDGADELDARPGDALRVFVAGRAATLRVKAIVGVAGAGANGPAVLVGLPAAQSLLGQPGRIREVLVSNRGGLVSGAELSDEVTQDIEPLARSLGLDVTKAKQDLLDEAEETGNTFMTFFTTFGSFSIMAGILLIFLIFVMLAAERRGELGIARAIGTRRSHLVQLFVFEGAVYDVAAAAVGALLGAGVAYGMVIVLSHAFGVAGFDVQYSVSARSLVLSFALGVLLTFAVVGASAWRVSVLTISTAIRNLPEPLGRAARRRSWILGLVGIAAGLLLALAGRSSGQATALLLGISLVLIGLVPVARALRAPERAVFTAAGLALIALWLLPWGVLTALFGELKMDFSVWIVSGAMLVVGAVWTIMYNADVVLAVAMRLFGRVRAIAPILKLAMAYPLASRFRTGTTLAMFTLVVFTMVTGTITTGSFMGAVSDVETFGGGYDVRATVSPASPVEDIHAALRRTPGVDAASVRSVAGASLLTADARQAGTGRPYEEYVLRGFDASFLRTNAYGLAATADGYTSSRQVWTALATKPGLAVVDSLVVQRRGNFGFGPAPKFRVSGFYLEDKHFAPVTVVVRDPQSGAAVRLRVIGVLKDSIPLELVGGIVTSSSTLERAFGDRARPTSFWFRLGSAVDPRAEAAKLESAFLANGMEAEALEETMEDTVGANLTFDRLILGFMGLGLVVGVAALGVISARSVVERRQQIGVLRSIGFRGRMVQASFLLESSFIALTAIVVGTALALVLGFNIIHDTQSKGTFDNLSFEVPWITLAIIFAVVYLVALVTTYLPARRAARLYPAEALRYQ